MAEKSDRQAIEKVAMVCMVAVVTGTISFLAGLHWDKRGIQQTEKVLVRSEGKIIGIEELDEKDEVIITGRELKEIIGWSFRQGFDGKKQFQDAVEKTKLEIQELKWQVKAPQFF